MNIHPAIVHFPIALLTLYCLCELVCFGFVKRHQFWFYIKAFMVIVGTLGTYVALMSGETAKHLNLFGQSRQNINAHANIAVLTTIVFSGIAFFYVLLWLEKTGTISLKKFDAYRRVFNILAIVFAITGIALITITGALGGALAYGPDNDPVASFFAHIFFK